MRWVDNSSLRLTCLVTAPQSNDRILQGRRGGGKEEGRRMERGGKEDGRRREGEGGKGREGGGMDCNGAERERPANVSSNGTVHIKIFTMDNFAYFMK